MSEEYPPHLQRAIGKALATLEKPGDSLNSVIPIRPGIAATVYGRGTVRGSGMNRTEENYSHLLEAQRLAGQVLWYKFEAIKFRLADNTFYTPDFAVMLADGTIEIHEVKGHWEDDARVKIKVAAETFPFIFRAFKPRKGGWGEETF